MCARATTVPSQTGLKIECPRVQQEKGHNLAHLLRSLRLSITGRFRHPCPLSIPGLPRPQVVPTVPEVHHPLCLSSPCSAFFCFSRHCFLIFPQSSPPLSCLGLTAIRRVLGKPSPSATVCLLSGYFHSFPFPSPRVFYPDEFPATRDIVVLPIYNPHSRLCHGPPLFLPSRQFSLRLGCYCQTLQTFFSFQVSFPWCTFLEGVGGGVVCTSLEVLLVDSTPMRAFHPAYHTELGQ